VTQLATPRSIEHSATPGDQRLEAKARRSCRSCGDRSLERVLDLGNLYVSGFADAPEPSE
jgi:hypothetical protein